MSLLGNITISCKHVSTNWDNGRAKETVTTVFTIVGSLQPPKQADLVYVPEARWINKMYKIVTFDTLTLGDQNNGADQLTIDNEQYEVMSAAKWKNGLLYHNVYIVGLVQAL